MNPLDILDLLIILLFLWCVWWISWRITMPAEVVKNQVADDAVSELVFCGFLPVMCLILGLCIHHLSIRFPI